MKAMHLLIFFLIGLLSPVSAQKVSGEVVGKWDVWIPGAVTYVATTDNRAQMVYQPGAAMNTLTIQANGQYTWGDHTGTVEIVKPWYAQVGVTYYRISDLRKNTYDFWYKEETDQLILLFGEVGGHAATGARIGEKQLISSSKDMKENQEPIPADFKIGQEVLVEWSGSWYNAKILEYKDGHFKIHYIGWGSTWDEWVKPSRIKPKATKK